MKQLLLFPDARPLVERLGAAFFRTAPETPGVYLMQDEAGTVLYVGKARNLRKRLGSYRVANPDRMRRRHLRLLRQVTCINFEECPDEASALAREAAYCATFSLASTGQEFGHPHHTSSNGAWRRRDWNLELITSPNPNGRPADLSGRAPAIYAPP